MLAGSRTAGAALLALAVAIFVGASNSHAAVEATCMGEPATIVGTENSDTLNDTEGDDIIVGLGGDDLIRGQGGSDLISTGWGNDRLILITGVVGSNFDDTIKGGAGTDVLTGLGGNDTITAGHGSDSSSPIPATTGSTVAPRAATQSTSRHRRVASASTLPRARPRASAQTS